MKRHYFKQKATLPVSVKLRNDYADYDYLDKLNSEELDWLKGFHREVVNADFNHRYKKHYYTDELKQFIYGLNNSRNRDLYGILKYDVPIGFVSLSEYYEEKVLSNSNPENFYIRLIDLVSKFNIK